MIRVATAVINARRAGVLVLMLALAHPLAQTQAQAQTQSQTEQPATSGQQVEALMDAMAIDDIIAIMREEGLAYGDELAADMLRGGGGAAWDMIVDQIYDVEVMRRIVRDGFSHSFGQADAEPLIRFFGSDTGRRIVELEVEARRAFMDAEIEDAARNAYRDVASDLAADSPRDIDPHLSAIESYVDANDLIGFNVMGAMNANRSFYHGLADGGAFPMSEAEIMSDLREQQAETEADTREWIYAFLMLAYAPLAPEQITAYADLSQTPHGRAMNSALFDAFDRMYSEVSHALGAAIAGQMLSEEL